MRARIKTAEDGIDPPRGEEGETTGSGGIEPAEEGVAGAKPEEGDGVEHMGDPRGEIQGNVVWIRMTARRIDQLILDCDNGNG